MNTERRKKGLEVAKAKVENGKPVVEIAQQKFPMPGPFIDEDMVERIKKLTLKVARDSDNGRNNTFIQDVEKPAFDKSKVEVRG